jgi:hypothetical protein
MMAVFSPKPRQLISTAIAEASESECKKTWWSWVQAHPDVRQPGEPWQGTAAGLRFEVDVATVWALGKMKRRLRSRRKRTRLSEDKAADLDNHLSRINFVLQFTRQGAPRA